jgi:hypothetical protein
MVFTIAFTALLGAQMALVSVLDPVRADAAAQQVADSQVAAVLVERAVRSSLDPTLDPTVVDAVVTAALGDRLIREVVRVALNDAHRQLIDAPVATAGDGNQQVAAAIDETILRIGAENGIDLSGVLASAPSPSVVPVRIPEINLQRVAEEIRVLAGAAATLAALLVIAIHPRRALGISSLGARAGVVTAIWLVGVTSAGWLLGRFGGSLLGDVLVRMWSASMGGVMTVLAAIGVLCFGVWLGGRAIDGLIRAR